MVSNFLRKRKDGGSSSPVDAYFLIEIKSLFSIALLKFNKGGREAFHTHAFDAYTWFLKGELLEECVTGATHTYTRSIKPKVTLKEKNHRVLAMKDSYCLTIRGPWAEVWTEYMEKEDTTTIFSWGRKIVCKFKGK
jgi:hypothetical protein